MRKLLAMAVMTFALAPVPALADSFVVPFGGAVGGGAGTAAVLSTRGPDVRLSPGARLSVRLVEALTVRVHIPREEHGGRSFS